jgi:hypothetical protein
VVQVRVLFRPSGLPVLQMVLRMLQMVGTSRVTSPNRTLLEMALEDITPTERVFAEMARIGSLARVWVMSGIALWKMERQTYGAADGA